MPPQPIRSVIGASLALGAAVSLATPLALAANERTPRNDKVMVTSCTVLFAVKSSGSSATRAGLFDDKKASQVTVQSIFTMVGVDEAAYQRMTDEICKSGSAALSSAGYDVVPTESPDEKATADFRGHGKDSPINKKIADVVYVGYAPTGQKVMDPALVSGLGQFKHPYAEATIAKQADARPVRLLYTVEFADVRGRDDKGRLKQNSAVVTADVKVSVSGSIVTYDGSKSKCYKGITGREACTNNDAIPGPNGKAQTFAPAADVSSAEPIVSVDDANSAVGQAALSAVNTLAMFAGTRRRNVSEYAVTVDPAKYESMVVAAAAAIAAENAATMKNPPAGKKK